MSLRDIIEGHRLVICVGTGGVGKTSLSAAIGLAGALLGRHAAVLTIDPAQALGRALGMRELGSNIARVDAASFREAALDVPGSLHAGMLEQASAWDGFIRRHASSPAVAAAILGNPFYRQLSRHFSGSTEYVALEELCRLHESGLHDLLVLDTPPAAHALDFLRAPERIDRLLDPETASFFAHSHPLATRVLGRFERATGRETFLELVDLLSSFQGLFAAVRLRSIESRALVSSDRTAFVLVTGPEAETIAGARALGSQMSKLGVRLKAVVQNRAHPLAGSLSLGAESEAAVLQCELEAAGAEASSVAWLGETHRTALAIARSEERRWIELERLLPADVARVRVPELAHDLHSLADLGEVGRFLLAN